MACSQKWHGPMALLWVTGSAEWCNVLIVLLMASAFSIFSIRWRKNTHGRRCSKRYICLPSRALHYSCNHIFVNMKWAENGLLSGSTWSTSNPPTYILCVVWLSLLSCTRCKNAHPLASPQCNFRQLLYRGPDSNLYTWIKHRLANEK